MVIVLAVCESNSILIYNSKQLQVVSWEYNNITIKREETKHSSKGNYYSMHYYYNYN